MKNSSKPSLPAKERPATLTKVEVIRAASNDPLLSTDKFTLGDREFTLLDLGYDDYMKFLTLFAPLFDGIFKNVAQKQAAKETGLPGLDTPSLSDVPITTIITYCADNLPQLAHIVCKQSDPKITVEEVKTLAKTPMKMVEIIMLQIKRNNIIKDFADFFQQILPLVMNQK